VGLVQLFERIKYKLKKNSHFNFCCFLLLNFNKIQPVKIMLWCIEQSTINNVKAFIWFFPTYPLIILGNLPNSQWKQITYMWNKSWFQVNCKDHIQIYLCDLFSMRKKSNNIKKGKECRCNMVQSYFFRGFKLKTFHIINMN
jgi:hypothetical protein